MGMGTGAMASAGLVGIVGTTAEFFTSGFFTSGPGVVLVQIGNGAGALPGVGTLLLVVVGGVTGRTWP
jgi:hypothetical protein